MFDSSMASNFASAALIIIPDLVVDETCGFLQLALSLLQMCVSRKCPNLIKARRRRGKLEAITTEPSFSLRALSSPSGPVLLDLHFASTLSSVAL